MAVVPAAIIGFLFEEKIDELFFNPTTVAIALIVYGILFIVLENRKRSPKIRTLNDLSYLTALEIGVFQVLALIPGTSRSGSTILGAIFLGTSRNVAAEFVLFAWQSRSCLEQAFSTSSSSALPIPVLRSRCCSPEWSWPLWYPSLQSNS